MNTEKKIDVEKLRSEIWPQQQDFFKNILKSDMQYSCADLVEAASHQVTVGGKRLRALIPSVAFSYLQKTAANFEQQESLKWFGLCAELIHSATLCHDDVMDGDEVRRHQPTVWVSYGTPQAINTGDFLIAVSEEAIHQSGASDAQKLRALRHAMRSLRIVIHGQAMEIQLRRDLVLPTLQNYEAVVIGKTGGLFSMCLVFAGVLADLDDSELNRLHLVGMKLGELFQIQDDIIDLIGEKGRGISGSDLWEGKPSWLIAHAATHLSPAAQEELRQCLYIPRSEKTQEDFQKVFNFLEESGAVQAGQKFLEDFLKTTEEFKKMFPTYAEIIEVLCHMIRA